MTPKFYAGLSLYVLTEWIVLTQHCCILQCLCRQLCSDIYSVCSVAANEHVNLNINCISGLASVKLNCLWLIHLKVITLRTRYNLVWENHQTRAQEEKLPPREKPKIIIVFYFQNVLYLKKMYKQCYLGHIDLSLLFY